MNLYMRKIFLNIKNIYLRGKIKAPTMYENCYSLDCTYVKSSALDELLTAMTMKSKRKKNKNARFVRLVATALITRNSLN